MISSEIPSSHITISSPSITINESLKNADSIKLSKLQTPEAITSFNVFFTYITN